MGKTSTRSDSKANRKFEKKLEFYSKVKEDVASLSTKKSIAKNKNKLKRRQKKLKAYNLSSLLDSLPELKASHREDDFEDDFKLSSKSRQQLVLKEGERLSVFLKDPSFQKDPLAAILDHLQITQPVIEEQPKKKVNINGSMKRKMKKSKAESALQSMDM